MYRRQEGPRAGGWGRGAVLHFDERVSEQVDESVGEMLTWKVRLCVQIVLAQTKARI